MSHSNYEHNVMTLTKHQDDQLEIVSTGKKQSKYAIVLLHGAVMNYKIMTVFEKYLHDVRLIFINCPGRGQSTTLNRKDHDLSDYATRVNEALVNIVETEHIEKLAIIGYSMGGLIATKLAGYNTLPITHLIYLNSAAKIDYKEIRISKLMTEVIKEMTPDTNDGMIKSIPEYVLERGTSKKYKNQKDIDFLNYFAPINAMITDLQYTLNTNYLDDIDCIQQMPDILFLLGEEDVIFPNKDSKETIERFEARGAKVKSIIYPDVGHLDFLRVLDREDDGQLGSIEYHLNHWLVLE
ncbi:alpha/beta fold hydrolase [Staphylococcus felis]|uniref:alpha/beta fold hydrolase n=1 Tax=Staphylococcus felis TaxID=46127 RepID=UPI000E248A18|nr:alpha/beta hydrolase [Staphylococcus felis]REH86968.1 alpha/beta hydrolase [Staphylococcus felis]REH88169.1 alpha/beta hydrolase [Staphylococcus felis]